MIHIISNNQDTVNDINVGGIIILDKEKDIWIGHYLNEAITEYINQLIIKDKYSDYYDLYILCSYCYIIVCQLCDLLIFPEDYQFFLYLLKSQRTK